MVIVGTVFRQPGPGSSWFYYRFDQCVYQSFIGVSLGANVLAARFYAAGKAKEMSETVHTSETLALISGLRMAKCGTCFSRWALEVMGRLRMDGKWTAVGMIVQFLGFTGFM